LGQGLQCVGFGSRSEGYLSLASVNQAVTPTTSFVWDTFDDRAHAIEQGFVKSGGRLDLRRMTQSGELD
jgi:hypothetical protein